MNLFGLGKKKQVAVTPFGGELRPPVVAPQRAISGFAVREFIILLMLVIAIVLTILNVGLAFIAQSRADATPYVADGSPFGCEVQEMRQ
ncbi:hypothetical protein SAMN04488527_13019 [Aliiroseovarius crassostreae]|uniref:Uncharacterized protein n=1 Tax=Aliiroseovarius crassostreae TaxID=154981 RepID=A0A0P7IGH8_9RHOB|nr:MULTISPECIES: hypothetical protein [Rhodobacterales]KPN62949.1 hypothetical protein AKJ29_02035 [Aliiroseovarius crassostreae]UTS82801.1 hypothetical protein OL67_003911 [Phaeobacter piscinae]SFU89539.1 hypothetical protein SAMN04488527_13019 [Aliiroseovarius crassostreae]